MKILFICGSVEPGKDGVGDYTRRLCGELIRSGHQAEILSICDLLITVFTSDNQEVEEIKVIANRIPITVSNNERYILAQTTINNFEPNWISLQYVPYSFNPKGLPFWVPFFLTKLKGNHKWHIMFHELWIGMDSRATFKDKCIGFIQKRLVEKILKDRKHAVVNTQTNLYKSKIAALNRNSQLLPLFSNIVATSYVPLEKIKDEVELKFCIFGGIHYGAPVGKFIGELKQVLTTIEEKRKLDFVFVGNCGAAIEEWKKVLLVNGINFEISGFVSDKKISEILSSCQFGISTTPYILNQKSGSLTTLFDHQLPVLCVARNWTVKGFNQEPIVNLINYEGKKSLYDFLNKKFIISNENNLEFVALKFLDGLK